MDSIHKIGFQITSEMSTFITLHDHYICFTRFILPSKNFNNFLLMTNLTHFFIHLFITSLYMFQASQCPSSGDRIVLMYHLV